MSLEYSPLFFQGSCLFSEFKFTKLVLFPSLCVKQLVDCGLLSQSTKLFIDKLKYTWSPTSNVPFLLQNLLLQNHKHVTVT